MYIQKLRMYIFCVKNRKMDKICVKKRQDLCKKHFSLLKSYRFSLQSAKTTRFSLLKPLFYLQLLPLFARNLCKKLHKSCPKRPFFDLNSKSSGFRLLKENIIENLHVQRQKSTILAQKTYVKQRVGTILIAY